MYQVPALRKAGYEAAELAISRPDLVTCCVLSAMRSRADVARRALFAGERALAVSGSQLPPSYDAPVSAFQMFSPASLNDDETISMWLDVYEMAAARRAAASGQSAIDLLPPTAVIRSGRFRCPAG
jgi:hypothetical protein